jgi:hypothetical protein
VPNRKPYKDKEKDFAKENRKKEKKTPEISKNQTLKIINEPIISSLLSTDPSYSIPSHLRKTNKECGGKQTEFCAKHRKESLYTKLKKGHPSVPKSSNEKRVR